MRTRTMIALMTIACVGVAIYNDNLAATYVAGFAGMIITLLHTIEVKINRLLDHHGILVTDSEVTKD